MLGSQALAPHAVLSLALAYSVLGSLRGAFFGLGLQCAWLPMAFWRWLTVCLLLLAFLFCVSCFWFASRMFDYIVRPVLCYVLSVIIITRSHFGSSCLFRARSTSASLAPLCCIHRSVRWRMRAEGGKKRAEAAALRLSSTRSRSVVPSTRPVGSAVARARLGNGSCSRGRTGLRSTLRGRA